MTSKAFSGSFSAKPQGSWKGLVNSTPIGKMLDRASSKKNVAAPDDHNAIQPHDDPNTVEFKKKALMNEGSFASDTALGSFKKSNGVVVKANIDSEALSDWERISAQHSGSFHATEPNTLKRGQSGKGKQLQA
eukprot:2107929-Rhodomonas_salina.1